MNAMYRPLSLALCSLIVLFAGSEASAQRYLNSSIVEATSIDDQMEKAMAEFIDLAVADLLSAKAEKVSAGRADLVRPLGSPAASDNFKAAFSKLLGAKLGPVATHAKTLVRLNAMIVLAKMTDDGSVSLITTGLGDKSVAVQRWAVSALRGRVQAWKEQEDKDNQIKAAVDAVVKKLNGRPAAHPIVVGPALHLFLDADTTSARAAFTSQLNARVAAHAADPDLSYAGELTAVGRFAKTVAFEGKRDVKSSAGLSRGAYRLASVIVRDIKAQNVAEDKMQGLKEMLGQCMTAMIASTAGAGKTPPTNLKAVTPLIDQGQWDEIQKLLTQGFAPILKAEPFKLTDDDLAI